MLVKVYKLIGPTLDWAVAKCENQEVEIVSRAEIVQRWRTSLTEEEAGLLNPPKPYLTIPGVGQAAFSTSWAQGGPIVDNNPIIVPTYDERFDSWFAHKQSPVLYGKQSFLVSTMRAYVASKLGDEVEIPDEIFKG